MNDLKLFCPLQYMHLFTSYMIELISPTLIPVPVFSFSHQLVNVAHEHL